MENTLESSSRESIRNNIGKLEAIELAALGFMLWFLITLLTFGDPDATFDVLLTLFLMIEIGLLGSWGLYNLFIRIARAIYRRMDFRLFILAAALTGTYTLWAWTILDINRWIMKKLFYTGEAPVEYAWSSNSKQVRKQWEEYKKAAQ